MQYCEQGLREKFAQVQADGLHSKNEIRIPPLPLRRAERPGWATQIGGFSEVAGIVRAIAGMRDRDHELSASLSIQTTYAHHFTAGACFLALILAELVDSQ